jgi:hypothetical protein
VNFFVMVLPPVAVTRSVTFRDGFCLSAFRADLVNVNVTVCLAPDFME